MKEKGDLNSRGKSRNDGKRAYLRDCRRHGSLLTKRQTTAVIDTMKDIAARELSAAGEIHFDRFAVLRTQDTPARMGRKPRTEEAMKIPAGRRIQFRPGQRLKDT